MNEVAKKYLECGELDKFCNGIYKEQIDKSIRGINAQRKVNLNIEGILMSMPKGFKYKPDHIDARNLSVMLDRYKVDLVVIIGAAKLAEWARMEFKFGGINTCQE